MNAALAVLLMQVVLACQYAMIDGQSITSCYSATGGAACIGTEGAPGTACSPASTGCYCYLSGTTYSAGCLSTSVTCSAGTVTASSTVQTNGYCCTNANNCNTATYAPSSSTSTVATTTKSGSGVATASCGLLASASMVLAAGYSF